MNRLLLCKQQSPLWPQEIKKEKPLYIEKNSGGAWNGCKEAREI